MHLRGGVIYPTHAWTGANTDATRASPWHLVVALDGREEAEGRLFLDDGEGIGTVEEGSYALVSFRASPGLLASTVVHHGLHGDLRSAGWNPVVSSVDILGLSGDVPYFVTVADNRSVQFEFSRGRLRLWDLYLMVDEPFWISFY